MIYEKKDSGTGVFPWILQILSWRCFFLKRNFRKKCTLSRLQNYWQKLWVTLKLQINYYNASFKRLPQLSVAPPKQNATLLWSNSNNTTSVTYISLSNMIKDDVHIPLPFSNITSLLSSKLSYFLFFRSITWNESKYGVFSGPYFPVFYWIRRFTE